MQGQSVCLPWVGLARPPTAPRFDFPLRAWLGLRVKLTSLHSRKQKVIVTSQKCSQKFQFSNFVSGFVQREKVDITI